MIKIIHRINTIKELRSVNTEYGVEIDIRTYGDELILSHDPFSSGESFDKWLDEFNHSFIILNVKEEGIEARIIDLLKKYKIENYFFLDLSYPFLIKTINGGEKKCSARYSIYEDINTVINLSEKLDWVWIDTIEKFSLTKADYKQMKHSGLKLCLVSPELIDLNRVSEIPKIKDICRKDDIVFDAVCTKKAEYWES